MVSNFFKLGIFRLSYNPGVANPKTMFFVPVDTTLPFDTWILLLLSSGIIVPRVITNGVYNVS